ncbi:MAG: Rieske 2Fe-2S domain-containing protein [Acidobacteria bacterium]|nr:Rieske 2Fe-2S domain-containing protein [Acidobacteriota bacterium]
MTNEPQFHRVASITEIHPRTGKTVAIGDQDIALFNVDGVFRAVNDFCPHRGASLGEGFLDPTGTKVLCPFHLFDFCLLTGESETAPSMKIATYEVRVEGGDVFVRV